MLRDIRIRKLPLFPPFSKDISIRCNNKENYLWIFAIIIIPRFGQRLNKLEYTRDISIYSYGKICNATIYKGRRARINIYRARIGEEREFYIKTVSARLRGI